MIRKSLKRFAAVLCAAVTMVSFSSTRVVEASTPGYWTTFRLVSYWNNWSDPAVQYISNHVELVGDGGYDARAKVNIIIPSYSLDEYEAELKFYYKDEYGKEKWHYKTYYQSNFKPGSYEYTSYGNPGYKYYAVYPTYRARITEHEYLTVVEGMYRLYY